jgi:hypothetical protein|tara:strand:+ start:36 stop:218 length:183 start_codon:yes stop_codon:yes gene_type:complete
MAKAIIHPWGVVITRESEDDDGELEQKDYLDVLQETMESKTKENDKAWKRVFNEIMWGEA